MAPGAFDKHGLRARIYEVRAEVTLKGCSHPVMLNQLPGFQHNGNPINVMTYYIRGKDGKYVYHNTP